MTRDGTRLVKALAANGLLLMSDQALPSAVTILAGGPVKGSWWSHPDGNRLYNVMNELFDHADTAAAPLVNGKVTFVHRELWPALAGAGAAKAAWQTAKLGPQAVALLKRVARAGELAASGPAAKLLETRLLVMGEQEHTASGAHGKILRTWARWGEARGLEDALPAAAGQAALEAAARALAAGTGAAVKLAWGTRWRDG